MKKLIKLLFWVVVALFCWGWVSDVLIGGMSTQQYFHALDMKFQQVLVNGVDKISKTKAATQITRNVRTFYGPVSNV